MYCLYITDSIGDSHVLNYKRLEYPTLLDLLTTTLFEDIGDCKGKGLCGTCHIRIKLSKAVQPLPDKLEKTTLKNQLDCYTDSRLACQILLDKHIHKAHIKIIGAD